MSEKNNKSFGSMKVVKLADYKNEQDNIEANETLDTVKDLLNILSNNFNDGDTDFAKQFLAKMFTDFRGIYKNSNNKKGKEISKVLDLISDDLKEGLTIKTRLKMSYALDLMKIKTSN